MWDVLVIGAGPVGLACAIAARRERLSAVVVDQGPLVASLVGYPTGMEFFSTPELLEIGGHPFATARYKPVREEALDYYAGVARAERLDLRLYERVQAVDGERDAFVVRTSRGEHHARRIVVAVGFFDRPNLLGVPGEELPHVRHYYKEPYPFVGLRLLVVGGKNSAAKAALDGYRHGAQVSLVHRGPSLAASVKYWIRPDLENRIREGSIRSWFDSRVTAIREGEADLATPNGALTIPADAVLAMTGYRPDLGFLQSLGIELGDDPARTPVFDSETFESSRAGVYLAGTVCGGLATSRWFIENGRFHARQIAAHVARGRVEPVELADRHWKTAE